MGKNALAFGGIECETIIRLDNSDTKAEIHNSLGVDTYASDENIMIRNGRIRFEVNDEEVKRELKLTGFNE